MNIPAAIVPAFIIKYFPFSTINVSAFATGLQSAGVNVITFVPPGTVIILVTTTSFPMFPDVPVRKRIVPQFIIPLIAVAVVIVVVLPPFAVRVFDHRHLAPQIPAPNVPAKAPEATCTQASSSK